MLRIDVKITGTKEIQRSLTKLGSHIYKLKPEMQEIGNRAERYYAGEVFATQGGVIGVHWKPVGANTKRFKASHSFGTGTQTLVRTGTMKRSFASDATDTGVTIYNTAPYFKYHQSTAPRKKMPYRPMMAINGEIKSIVSEVINVGIRKRIDRAGL
jgi:phage gpG-like protein